MKTKFYWVSLLASAAMIAQAKAGGHYGGGGGGFAAPAPAHISASSSHAAPTRSFGGGRMIYSGQRFSSVGMRSPSSPAFRQHSFNPNADGRTHQITRQMDRGDRLAGFSNARADHPVTNLRRQGNGQIRSGNNLPTNWRNHVVAQHSANWHRDWDQRRDQWWRGHHCRFINGSWVVFDVGFYPWWPAWYPYDYYGYDYYPYSYSYNPDYYYGADSYQGGEYYNDSGDADQYSNSTVAAAQERLAQQGYYRGQIDGVVGPETRRALLRYQGDHNLRVTGNLTTDTLQALGLREVAIN